jgi:RND family efflux transporter MFP subunit
MAQAGAREAEAMLSYTEIKAPFDGVITRKHASQGDLALPGQPLLEIEDLNQLRVEADIPEALMEGLEKGAVLQVQASGLSAAIEAIVEEIAPAADPASRTFPIKLSLPENNGLRSGQFVKVKVPSGKTQSILVPREALSQWGQIERVFEIHEGHLRMRIVKTGAAHGEQMEVLSGLNGGESLAITRGSPLKDGLSVK